MKALWILGLTFFLISCDGNLPISNSPIAAPPSEKPKIIAAFNAYKESVLAQDGAAAVKLLSSSSVTYFDQILSHVLHAGKEEIQALPSGDILQILSVRYSFPKEQLLEYDGQALYEAVTNNQMTENKQLAIITLGKIAVKGNKAKGQMVAQGQPSSIFFDFRKEQNQWKLDLTTTLVLTNKVVEQQAKEANLSVPEYLETILQLSEEEKEAIWKPLT